ncbi:MAG: ATP-binding cassette domain-containing protein, partial [candidate division WOR-3 bacterium]|nr:ATP-binding cassette domain-containing protein [candidate division WOR-3 bacterium]
MIEIKNLSKQFDGHYVLRDVNFRVEDGKLVVVLGPSGTGKTVLLKSILNLIPVDRGEVYFDGINIFTAGTKDLYEIRKKVGFVFQSSALFDSMNVYENIALPLFEHTSITEKEAKQKVKHLLEIVGLPGREKLYPRALSGGMKRLVAIARAMALEPTYLFYDEPTTGLDPVMRERIVNLIVSLKRDFKKSGIVVTHDLETAQITGDAIYMLKDGQIKKLERI